MKFATCLCEEKSGVFTIGRVYKCKSFFNLFSNEYMFSVIDENDKLIPVDNNSFRMCDYVYGVVVKSFKTFFVGQIVRIDEVTDDGLYHLSSGEFITSKFFIILDRSNVLPGFYLCRSVDGKWMQVNEVLEDMTLVFVGEDDVYLLDDFSLCVHDGEILSEPLAYCVDNCGSSVLTQGKQYLFLCTFDNMVKVEDDEGKIGEFMIERFSLEKIGKNNFAGDVNSET